jgi:curli biogenesis system outer membrane secretion channel CsgG
MKKKIFYLLAVFVFSISGTAFAAKPAVAVMDFGIHKGAVTSDVNIDNTDKAASVYIIERLVENNWFTVIEKELVEKQIEAENLNTTGLIDPDTAKRLGELLHAKYIVYGNVVDVSTSETGTAIASNGVNICTVKSHIILRVMDADTGYIVAAAKGEGKSKSSYVAAGNKAAGVVKIGTITVSQDSVHNAVQKAAYMAVDKLAKSLGQIK